MVGGGRTAATMCNNVVSRTRVAWGVSFLASYLGNSNSGSLPHGAALPGSGSALPPSPGSLALPPPAALHTDCQEAIPVRSGPEWAAWRRHRMNSPGGRALASRAALFSNICILI